MFNMKKTPVGLFSSEQSYYSIAKMVIIRRRKVTSGHYSMGVNIPLYSGVEYNQAFVVVQRYIFYTDRHENLYIKQAILNRH